MNRVTPSCQPFAVIFMVAVCTAGTVRGEDNGTAKDFRLPAGFEITEFADSRLANDIYTLAIDPEGRIFVSGRGYITLLEDTDNDGKADQGVPFSTLPKDGAMGLLAERDSVFFTGDGGLYRLRDQDRDGRADGPPELIRKMKTGDEHTAHAIRRGPDGWLYVLVGNSTDINARFAELTTSPIKNPIAGCVLRFTPDLTHSEIVADGFRNPYDMDFNLDGELFTYDSDNERCVSLPWYEFTRCYHVTPGSHHGWNSHQLAETWRSPPHWIDVAEPVSSIARGSPTGVECYRHRQFPAKFHGALFLLDWTFGKVYALGLEPKGSTYRSTPEIFLESLGSNGFAPTDAAVHPVTGDLYLSIGGRGSRGAVYRIRYPAGLNAGASELPILSQSLAWDADTRLQILATAQSGEARARRRALETIQRFRNAFTEEEICAVFKANLSLSDRPILNCVAGLVSSLSIEAQRRLLDEAATPVAKAVVGFAMTSGDPTQAGATALELLHTSEDEDVRLAAIRVLEIAVGDVMDKKKFGTVWEGYSRRHAGPVPAGIQQVIETLYPTNSEPTDTELSRLAAMLELESPLLLAKLASELTPDSDPVADIHRLIVIARLKGLRSPEVTNRVADALLSLDHKLSAAHRNRDRNWPNRIREMYAQLLERDSSLFTNLLDRDLFTTPGNVLFATVGPAQRLSVARKFLERIQKEPEYELSAPVVDLLGALPTEETFTLLRDAWVKHPNLHPALLDLLARAPADVDREKFLDALSSTDLSLVELGLDAIEMLTASYTPSELALLIKGYRHLPAVKETLPLRTRYVERMREVTGQASLGLDKEVWVQWFCAHYPEHAEAVRSREDVPMEAWTKRWAQLDWKAGNAANGANIFSRAGCMSCHNGGRAVGPTLGGVTKRFSQSDLLTALVDPNRDVSERYQTELIATDDGNLYQGMVVYEAVDSLILQTGPERTTRIDHRAITERRQSRKSLMPVGLLDQCSDQEIVDLVTYLESLPAQ